MRGMSTLCYWSNLSCPLFWKYVVENAQTAWRKCGRAPWCI